MDDTGKENFEESLLRKEGGRCVAIQNEFTTYGVVWRYKYKRSAQISKNEIGRIFAALVRYQDIRKLFLEMGYG